MTPPGIKIASGSPRRAASVNDNAMTSSRNGASTTTGARRGVAVVVDDEPEFAAILSEYLTLCGFDVKQAAHGLEALMHVKRERPRLVLLDVHMPRLGGLDALRRIRAFDPNITVVVVTADADPELQRQALALGAARVLLKPMNPLDLGPALGLPSLDTTASAPPAESSVPESPEPPAATGGLILVVDDDPEMRAMLEDFLTIQGHRSRSAGDSLAALIAIEQEPPDVVLLDIDMPGLSGADALPAIRTVAAGVKVIMVSGTHGAEISKRFLAQGAFDYVAKPIDFAYLARSLEAALRVRRMQI